MSGGTNGPFILKPKRDDEVVYGIRMIWLGRAGDIGELAGAILVVADLLGQDRLRKIGYAFSAGKTSPTSVVKQCGLAILAFVVFGAALFALNTIDEHYHLSEIGTRPGLVIVSVAKNLLYGFLAIGCVFCAFWLMLLPPFLMAALSAQRYGVVIFRTAGWLLVTLGTALVLLAS